MESHLITPQEQAWLKDQWELAAGKGHDAYLQKLLGCYTEIHRYYHNLHHIMALLNLAGKYESRISRPDVMRLAIWYHDAVYDVSRKDNEEKSAAMARADLQQMHTEESVISEVEAFILATQTHSFPEGKGSEDGYFFLDLDLSILAASPEKYDAYTQQVRREYKVYPMLLYRKGRKKAMQHFLLKPRIYHTEFCYEMWEKQARENIAREVSLL